MPTEHLIKPHLRLVISRGTGDYDFQEHVRHMERLQADPLFQPDYDHIVDCRGFSLLNVTKEQFMVMSRNSIFSPRSRRVFIAVNDTHFGLSRVFASLREVVTGTPVMVFRTMNETVAYLGLPADFDPDAPPPPAGA